MSKEAAAARSAWKIIPQFQSRSIEKTVESYTKTLGFEFGGLHPDDDGSSPATFCSVAIGRKSDANIYFFKSTDEFHPSGAHIALGTAELDEYWELLSARPEVDVLEKIEDKPWGYRQFTIRDVDGNKLTFFKFLEGGNPGSE